MALSTQLISQFAKVTKSTTKPKTETTVYGTTVNYNGKTYVKLDGSDLLTPVESTVSIKENERVTVSIKDHSATVTGNLSDPSASANKVHEIGNQITEFEIVLADKVSTKELEAETARINELVSENVIIKNKLTAAEANIINLEAEDVTIHGELEAANANIQNLDTKKLNAETANATFATIKNLEATDAKVYNLEATYGEFENLTTRNFESINANIQNLDTKKLNAETANATFATIKNLEASNAEIEDLKTKKLDAEIARVTYATIKNLEASDAKIEELETKKLNAEIAKITYADINFANINWAAVEKIFSESGIIKDLVVSSGNITGELVGVTIKGDLIETNTLKADRLVVKGSDGIYYKLNVEGGATTSEKVSEEDLQNGLSGEIIVAKSITAEKVAVDDLVAFGATIGGFKLTTNALYSGVKSTVENTTRGVYFDNDGQFAVGDTDQGITYYRTSDGTYRLIIDANNITFGDGKKSVETEINNTNTDVSNLTDSTTTSITNLNTSIENTNENVTALTDSVNSDIVDINAKLEDTKESITDLSNKIDSNNLSLSERMDATDEALTYLTNTSKEDIQELQNELDAADNRISVIKDVIDDLSPLGGYIHIDPEFELDPTTGQYVPAIILGDSKNDFKVIITNKEIAFAEGTTTPAYISGQTFIAQRINVKQELQQGGFSWINHSGGNLGLVWKGTN